MVLGRAAHSSHDQTITVCPRHARDSRSHVEKCGLERLRDSPARGLREVAAAEKAEEKKKQSLNFKMRLRV